MSRLSISGCIIVYIIVILSWGFCAESDSVQGHCSREDKDCTYVEGSVDNSQRPSSRDAVKQRYSRGKNEKWNNILTEVETALDNYAVRSNELKLLPNGNCSLYWNLIEQDLSAFKEGITSHLVQTARSRGSFYQIIDGKLYRDSTCKFPTRCKGIEHFLKKIAKYIPNVEFVVNTSDWPQISSHFPEPLPVFSFSKTKDYADIIYPAWTFWEGGPSISLYPKGIGRWDLLRKSITDAAKKYPWDKKEVKAFFRGSRTSSERDALIYLSRKYPDLVDAQYTKNQAWKSDADTLNAPAAAEVSLEDHCKYKYLFNYRGVAASFRFKHLFVCKSVVFHVGEDWIEFYYPELKPWVHYIPVNPNSDVNELRSLLQFAKENDQLVASIAERGYSFIKKHLKMKHILCYWKTLLLRYSKLLVYDVKKHEDVKLL